ncbi:hypothetical protein MAR_037669 [Mya arenaria]|uniref:Uncharacterized protein n=1 Tax=Mya arenaria TaxID=6604 RepID=A0ABY7FPK8_MYAAR|nr:hypothetical protein MAR_037669 [Mya arenaria]
MDDPLIMSTTIAVVVTVNFVRAYLFFTDISTMLYVHIFLVCKNWIAVIALEVMTNDVTTIFPVHRVVLVYKMTVNAMIVAGMLLFVTVTLFTLNAKVTSIQKTCDCCDNIIVFIVRIQYLLRPFSTSTTLAFVLHEMLIKSISFCEYTKTLRTMCACAALAGSVEGNLHHTPHIRSLIRRDNKTSQARLQKARRDYKKSQA